MKCRLAGGGAAARRAVRRLLAALLMAWPTLALAQAEPGITPTPRGAVIQSPSVRVEIVDGAIAQITNLHTSERLLRDGSDLRRWATRVPAGLGTIAAPEERAAATTLHAWPWNEMGKGFALPNQHFPDGRSTLTPTIEGPTSALLAYADLTDGARRFPDETFSLRVGIDPATGDVLITPTATTTNAGAFSTNLLVAPTRRQVSIDAPIFDGMRLTGDMKTNLWVNQSGYWDYPLLAYNGEDRGAVGIWAQDATFAYKSLMYLADGSGIATSFCTIVNPPFDQVREVTGVTWRIQAFDTSWAQVAARYRTWRAKEIKVAPRPSWVNDISFVNSGVNASKQWLTMLGEAVGVENLRRTITFMPVIRAAQFDTKHWDNSAYPAFGDEAKAWREAGAKSLAYLQPMIMWGNRAEVPADAKKVVEMSDDANTRSAFSGKKEVVPYHDQHHLGHPAWQAWFLACVKNFIDLGADGVYHDQSYPVPIDGRGPVDGMNSIQGMVDYFFKAATQSPGTIHGTEHLTEANIVGASLGIGSGIHWGVAPTLRMQRIRHASPISNALHHPLGVIWAFPHMSQLGGDREWTRFDWGMDLQERRGDIAGFAIQSGVPKPMDQLVNQPKLDWWRGRVFATLGLRPVFPDHWDRAVRSYFRGAGGQDVRYEDRDFGSEFVEYVNDSRTVIYNRITDTTAAETPLNIAGWFFYNANGPSGLHPQRYYLGDPSVKRPKAYFMPGFAVVPGTPIMESLYESFVDQGTGNDAFLWLRIRPLDVPGRVIAGDKVRLRSPRPPTLVLVNGKPEKVTPVADDPEVHELGLQTPADVVVFLEPVSTDFATLKDRLLARQVGSTNLDGVNPRFVTQTLVTSLPVKPDEAATKLSLRMEAMKSLAGCPMGQIHLPMQVAGDQPVTYRLLLPDNATVALNGMPVAVAQKTATVVIKPGQPALVSVFGPAQMQLVIEQVAATPPPAGK